MSESARKTVKYLVMAVLFLGCMALVIVGQRNVGPVGLLTMLAGLAGLIAMLWYYNRQYK